MAAWKPALCAFKTFKSKSQFSLLIRAIHVLPSPAVSFTGKCLGGLISEQPSRGFAVARWPWKYIWNRNYREQKTHESCHGKLRYPKSFLWNLFSKWWFAIVNTSKNGLVSTVQLQKWNKLSECTWETEYILIIHWNACRHQSVLNINNVKDIIKWH